MDSKITQHSLKNRFNKLSLKKNKIQTHIEENIHNYSSDVIVLDDSFDILRTKLTKIQTSTKIYSPIVIDDSSEISLDNDLSHISFNNKEPSKNGQTSCNNSINNISIKETKTTQPSNGGWSPHQSIICATPRHQTVPTTPKDVANESLEQCSIKQIQQSQKKLMDELYGEIWQSIPKLIRSDKSDKNLESISKKLDFSDDSDKENVRHVIRKNKELYLTDSDARKKAQHFSTDTEKKSKKKLYTEKINTPDVTKHKSIQSTVKRDVKSTTKKLKYKTVTELVQIMNENKSNLLDAKVNKICDNLTSKQITNKTYDLTKVDDDLTSKTTAKKTKKLKSVCDNVNVERDAKKADVVNELVKKVRNVCVTPVRDDGIKRLTFMGSLADNVPAWRCHIEALNYIDNYKSTREQLARRLFTEFNDRVFQRGLDADMPVLWDGKLRSTAGTTTNRKIKTSSGDCIRSSTVKLSTKVVDGAQRLRDTLIHELCHAATWVIDHELRAGHGPLWKRWATRALQVYPELGEISRCHNLEIHFKYSYKCTKCGYSVHNMVGNKEN